MVKKLLFWLKYFYKKYISSNYSILDLPGTSSIKLELNFKEAGGSKVMNLDSCEYIHLLHGCNVSEFNCFNTSKGERGFVLFFNSRLKYYQALDINNKEIITTGRLNSIISIKDPMLNVILDDQYSSTIVKYYELGVKEFVLLLEEELNVPRESIYIAAVGSGSNAKFNTLIYYSPEDDRFKTEEFEIVSNSYTCENESEEENYSQVVNIEEGQSEC